MSVKLVSSNQCAPSAIPAVPQAGSVTRPTELPSGFPPDIRGAQALLRKVGGDAVPPLSSSGLHRPSDPVARAKAEAVLAAAIEFFLPRSGSSRSA